MKRLTEWAKNGYAYLSGVKDDEQEVKCKSKNTLQCIIDAFNQLAAYEDTNHTPKECAAAFEELERKWISVNEGLPDAETEVFVRCISSTGYETYTTALYEDGTINADESCWNWFDLDFNYNEETNEYMVPEGWWEYRHYNDDDVLNNVIDDKVTHWMPITKKKQGDNDARNL